MSENKRNDDDLIGRTIAGRYRIISRLGAGGMGVAYRAWDEQDGVPVVIKIPKKALLDDPKFAERFAREIRLLQGLGHPHIVPIVDVGEHEGLPYVAMRFLPGGSLSNRRLRGDDGRARSNPPGMLHLWLPAVADALDHVHSNGVVHRDVKPANIFFDAFWGAFLGDFGIAKIIEESESFDRELTLTATNMGIGTQEYMAPEQFSPKPVLDGRTDQYALAVTVYEMLAGTRPFTGTTAHIVVEVMTMPVPRLDRAVRGLPASLVEAIHRGLAKNPAERFANCRQFAAAVLADVSPLADEPDLARLLCPNCSNLLKLPVNAAGRKGKCPKCKTEMKVAADLGALWLLDEAGRQKESTASLVDAEFSPDSTASGSVFAEDPLGEFQPVSGTTPASGSRRRPRRLIFDWLDSHGLAVAGGMMTLAAIPWLLLLLGGSASETQQSLASKDAEIRRLSEQLAERGRQLDAAAEAKDAAEKQLQAARAETDAARLALQELEAQVAARPPTATAADSPAANQTAQEILAQPPIENSIGMKLKLIPPGTFMMGSEDGDDDEKPVHEVRITKPFYLGVTEVTNAQWRAVMGGEPPSKWKDDERPVEQVSWDDAIAFCQKLSNLNAEQAAGRAYRLPTEAEWEYACRAGTTTGWSSGDDEKALEDFAWFAANSGGQTHPVGQKKANPWGLFDVHGNVWEWCGDWSGRYAEQATDDPRGPDSGSLRVYRSGGFRSPSRLCRSANRSRRGPSDRRVYLGFRLAMSPSGSTQPESGQPGVRKAEQATGGASSKQQETVDDLVKLPPAKILARPPLENSIGMKLKLIPAGKFMMGAADGEDDEKPIHEVRITKPFFLGVTEVTNAQWRVVMGGEPPSRWKNNEQPVEQVTWNEAVAFCQKLSNLNAERAAGRAYRLPTEAEWEYACRAGTTTRWSNGDDEKALEDFAWFDANSGGQTRPVGRKRANPWGLHDMHGSVWEWCADWYGPYPSEAMTDAVGVAQGSGRVQLGRPWPRPQVHPAGSQWRRRAHAV